MKKTFFLLIVFLTFIESTFSATLDSKNWYLYNGYSNFHNFSVKFPTDWQVKILSDDIQGFYPKGKNTEAAYLIEEFEGQTFEQVINYYIDENLSLLKGNDLLFQASNEDLIIKEAIYVNKKNQEIPKLLIKRGSLILVLSKNSISYDDILQTIQKSFRFTDNWHQYIDFKEEYTFIFPGNLELNTFDSGLEIKEKNENGETIFELSKYENLPLNNVIKSVLQADEEFVSKEEINFHGLKAIEAVYKNTESNLKFGRIFIEKNSNSYALTNLNLEDNFPHSNYYDENIAEILESFEFFEVEVEEGYSAFQNFPDIRDNHPNAKAINSLVTDKVINGYNDGTFKPDGEINRAELTKMVVATKLIPDAKKYNNCFPDVSDQWYAPYICYAREKNWVEGYKNGKFKPEATINRAEALKIILEVFFNGQISLEDLKDTSVVDVKSQDWFYKYFIFADNRDLLDKQHVKKDKEKYYYYPGKNITRKEVAETIFRAKNLK